MPRIRAVVAVLMLAAVALCLGPVAPFPSPAFQLRTNGLGQRVWVLASAPADSGLPVAQLLTQPLYAVAPPQGPPKVIYGLVPRCVTSVEVAGHAATLRRVDGGSLWWVPAPQAPSTVRLMIGDAVVASYRWPSGPAPTTGRSLRYRLQADVLSAAQALADTMRGDVPPLPQRSFPGLTVLPYATTAASPLRIRDLGLGLPARARRAILGWLAATSGGRKVYAVFAVQPDGLPYPPEGASPYVEPAALQALPGAPSRSLRPRAVFDQGPVPSGATPLGAVRGFYYALSHRTAGFARPYVTSPYFRSIDVPFFGGLSNPHAGPYQVLGVRSLEGGLALVRTRAWQAYTGFGLGYGVFGASELDFLVRDRHGVWRIEASF